MVLFGQIVLGPPGSGKSTYVQAMSQFLTTLGRRVSIINLDPANDFSINQDFKKPDIDIEDLIKVEDAMEKLKLGPNGALIYAMEYLESNSRWLMEKIKTLAGDTYVLIDCPGQVELYTHNDSVKNVIRLLSSKDNPLLRLCAVHLVDSHYCNDAGKFISICLTSLTTMLQIELPHINILSKCDLIEKFGKLKFNIDYYTEVLDLSYLIDTSMDESDPFVKKYKKLNEAMKDLIDNYSLVNFLPLSIDNKERMLSVKNAIDKANGYCFGSEEERNIRTLMSSAMGVTDFEYAKTSFVREQFMDQDDNNEEEKIGNDLDEVYKTPGFQV